MLAAPRSEARACQSICVTAISAQQDVQRVYAGVFFGRQRDMGNLQIMIMDGRIADGGEIDETARLGLRPGLLNRRSFLFGSAIGLGALGLAGCATSDGMSFAE